MANKIAINGFGRIGRMTLRALLETTDSKHSDLEIVAINDLSDVASLAYLLKYDSVHGKADFEISHSDTNLLIATKNKSFRISVIASRDPKDIDWQRYGTEVVIEATGHFTTKELATKHLAKTSTDKLRVIVAAPCKQADKTVVYGVNHTEITFDDKIISNASCTTNCLAPLAKVLDENIGISSGFMTTIHSYTGDQRLLDNSHKDRRRGRAAALSMIPTSTGAAQAVGLVLPKLRGKLDGSSIRVPTPNVSLVDFKFISNKSTSIEEVNNIIIKASQSSVLRGILTTCDEDLISVDFIHNPASSVFDLSQTYVMDTNLVRVVSWYDNEWGFSNRLLDLCNFI